MTTVDRHGNVILTVVRADGSHADRILRPLTPDILTTLRMVMSER